MNTSGYDSRRCSSTGKLKTLCGCDSCLIGEPEAEKQAREERWVAQRRAEREAELATLSAPSVAETQARFEPRQRAGSVDQDTKDFLSHSKPPVNPSVAAFLGSVGSVPEEE